MRLPRLTIEPSAPSRFIIKRQPAAWCLSTNEAAHELLLALEAGSLDVYPDKNRLFDAFDAMQDFQIRQTAKAACAVMSTPAMPGDDPGQRIGGSDRRV